ncbi:hypothetical protein BE04_15605 [Sorangium cellulosum]|uniref:CBM3 domain-containing protein n=2 Tax=Sorangium cellulosum TaxID=56 RepID=A0A150Q311_SORCE|nr:hypothetical protein SCE1572_00360 [Sorangium cellulosum So0157-2]KYF62401.1 hypothetical protein BE04_15605 [Sorangium cellulosum]
MLAACAEGSSLGGDGGGGGGSPTSTSIGVTSSSSVGSSASASSSTTGSATSGTSGSGGGVASTTVSSSAGGDGGAGGIGGAGGEGGADVTSTTASSSVSTTASSTSTSSTTSATASSSVSTTASSTTSATTGVGGGSATSSTTASSTTGGATTPALELQYAARETGAEAQQLSFKVQIRNTGDERIALSDLTIRYWFTADVEMVDLKSECDFSGVTGGCANVTRAFHAASGTDADHYLELGFSAAAGSINAGATSGESQIRIYNREVYDRMTQTDDYSFEATTAWTPSMQITVYYDGELAWGVEP